MMVLRTKNAILFLVLFIPLMIFIASPVHAEEPVVCYVDTTEGVCIEGLDSETECPEGSDCEEFNSYCPAATNEEDGDTPWCSQGCCCASSDVPNLNDWNSDLDNTEQIQAACVAINQNLDGTYVWSEDEGDFNDCSSFCMGEDITPPAPEPETVEITVTVLDEGEEPAHGARVVLAGQTRTTNDEGLATFTLTQSDDARLIFSSQEGCEATREVTPDDDRLIELTLDCDISSCEVEEHPTIEPTILRGSNNISLTMTAGTGCPFLEYSINVADEEGTTLPGPGTTTSNQATHTNVEAETKYCYTVTAIYAGENVKTSEEPTCRTTGVLECMLNEDARWCEQRDYDDPESVAKKMSCDENNQLNEDPCDEQQMCTLSSTGNPVCVDRAECETCNGLFGLVSNLAHKLQIPGFGTSFFSCDGSIAEPYCYQDKSSHVTDAYKSCEQVTSCEDYLSQSACSDNNCLEQNCNWKELHNLESSDELTLGVCQPEDEELPVRCDACDELYGGCSEQVCEEIGLRGSSSSSECYFDERANNLDQIRGCIHKEQTACRYYDTQQDCTGGAQDRVRIDSQTHEVTYPSNDVFDIGVCRWNDEEDFCYKDADGQADDTNPRNVDDCDGRTLGDGAGTTRDCYTDSTPPTTTIILPETSIRASAISSLVQVIVEDNQYDPQFINTFFCMDFDDSCYPEKNSLTAAAADIINEIEVGETDQVFLRYYSQDHAKNLEEVQTTTIQLLNTGEALVESITIR